VKYFSQKLNVAIIASRSSITIDFSCVTSKAGLVSITSTPALASDL